MFIKNNSKREWLQYKIDGQIVDIKAESTFEISNEVGNSLLKILGCDEWLVETTDPKKEKTKKIEVEKKSTKKIKK